jgi:hypothetical protein
MRARLILFILEGRSSKADPRRPILEGHCQARESRADCESRKHKQGSNDMKRTGFIRDLIGATLLFVSWYVIFVVLMAM